MSVLVSFESNCASVLIRRAAENTGKIKASGGGFVKPGSVPDPCRSRMNSLSSLGRFFFFRLPEPPSRDQPRGRRARKRNGTSPLKDMGPPPPHADPIRSCFPGGGFTLFYRRRYRRGRGGALNPHPCTHGGPVRPIAGQKSWVWRFGSLWHCPWGPPAGGVLPRHRLFTVEPGTFHSRAWLPEEPAPAIIPARLGLRENLRQIRPAYPMAPPVIGGPGFIVGNCLPRDIWLGAGKMLLERQRSPSAEASAIGREWSAVRTRKHYWFPWGGRHTSATGRSTAGRLAVSSRKTGSTGILLGGQFDGPTAPDTRMGTGYGMTPADRGLGHRFQRGPSLRKKIRDTGRITGGTRGREFASSIPIRPAIDFPVSPAQGKRAARGRNFDRRLLGGHSQPNRAVSLLSDHIMRN